MNGLNSDAEVFLYFVPFLALQIIGLWKIFEKANEQGWKAVIPFYNLWVWIRITGKPWWWFVLLFVPVINVLVYLSMLVEVAKVFGKFDFWNQALSVLFAPFYFLYLGFSGREDFIGPDRVEAHRQQMPKSSGREWLDAIAFAVVAATIIRWFMIEAYTIPTSSMEKTLLVGDFLFVSKVHYGARVPNTPLSFPFAHNTLPLFDSKSYLEWIEFPYRRFPGFEDIEREDIVVFNYPRELDRPVDKRENYIKRCVGLPGDTLEVRSGEVVVNGKQIPRPPEMQYRYFVKTNGRVLNQKKLHEMQVTEVGRINQRGEYQMMLTRESVNKLRKLDGMQKVEKILYPEGHYEASVYPYYKPLGWNIDYFGPLYIPAQGDSIELKQKNFKLYEMVIREYEGNKSLKWKDGKAYISGRPAGFYEFEMDYYFMMGDNRHNSADSRMWGFVPEDHIVGKPLVLWLSWDKNASSLLDRIRWERLFTLIQ